MRSRIGDWDDPSWRECYKEDRERQMRERLEKIEEDLSFARGQAQILRDMRGASQKQITAAEKVVAALEATKQQAENVLEIVDDELALTAPLTDDTPDLLRVSVHRKGATPTNSIPHAASPLDSWRQLEVMVKNRIEICVCDLTSYGEVVYTKKVWMETMAKEHAVDAATAEKHLATTATIKDTVYFPGEERVVIFGPKGLTLNRWRGFTVAEVPFGRETGAGYCAETALWFHTVFSCICRSDVRLFKRFCSWVAFMFQRQMEKPGIALLLVSRTQGAGKNTVVHALDQILGMHSRVETTAERISKEGQSAFMANLRLLVIDEAVGANDDMMARLKALITETDAPLRNLFQESKVAHTNTMFMILSNKLDAGLDLQGSRRLQHMMVLEKRLWHSIGELLRNPRDKELHFGQLLHVFRSISFTDSLHHVIETAVGHDALCQQKLKEHPALGEIYRLATASRQQLDASVWSARGNVRCMRHRNAGNEDREQRFQQLLDDATENGFFTMAAATFIDRMSNAIFGHNNRGNQSGISTWMRQFTVSVAGASDKKLEDLGISPGARQALTSVPVGHYIIPNNAIGWRHVAEIMTGMKWEEIFSIFRLDIESLERGTAQVDLDEGHFAAIANIAIEEGDIMWRDIAGMIR